MFVLSLISQRVTKPTKWHPPSLIRVFAVRMKKAWGLCYPLRAQQKLIRLSERMPRLIWVFAGRICHFVGFVMLWLFCFVLLRWGLEQLRQKMMRFQSSDPSYYHMFLSGDRSRRVLYWNYFCLYILSLLFPYLFFFQYLWDAVIIACPE